MGRAQSMPASRKDNAENYVRQQTNLGRLQPIPGYRTLSRPDGKYSATFWQTADNRSASLARSDLTSSFGLDERHDEIILNDDDYEGQPPTNQDDNTSCCDQLVRKLSNVSNRNIQLLALKNKSPPGPGYVANSSPRHDSHQNATGQGGVSAADNNNASHQGQQHHHHHQRRRSSLINVIFGAPRAGPRFSDDLCYSLDRSISPRAELFNNSRDTIKTAHPKERENVKCRPMHTRSERGPVARARHLTPASLSTNHYWRTTQSTGLRRSSSFKMGGSSMIGESPVSILGVQQRADHPLASSSSFHRSGSELSLYGSFAWLRRHSLNGDDLEYAPSIVRDTNNNQNLVHGGSERRPESKTLSPSPIRGSSLITSQMVANYEQSPAHDGLVLSAVGERQSSTPSQLPIAMSLPSSSDTSTSEAGLILDNISSTKDSTSIYRYKSVQVEGSSSQFSCVNDRGRRESCSGGSDSCSGGDGNGRGSSQDALHHQTSLIILYQVCLPFVLAGFGNMAAGLAFSRLAQWRAFKEVSTFLVLLPSFVGLKGNIEMTLASRLSTMSNINLLQTSYQRRHAYISNLVLMISHAIGLSVFATFASVVCQFMLSGTGLLAKHSVDFPISSLSNTAPPNMSSANHTNLLKQEISNNNSLGYADCSHLNEANSSKFQCSYGTMDITNIPSLHHDSVALMIMNQALMVVLPCALATSILLVFLSSLVIWWTVSLANMIHVNPDNLSTLVAALYGDVTCVLTYGLFAEWMHQSYIENISTLPLFILISSLVIWLICTLSAYKLTETRDLVISSIAPTLTSIIVSLGSGVLLSIVLGRFARIALYQPVVNGFGANLIAAQASRISTWLWCQTIRKMSIRQPSGYKRLDILSEHQNYKTQPFEFEASSIVEQKCGGQKSSGSFISFIAKTWSSPHIGGPTRTGASYSYKIALEKLKGVLKFSLAALKTFLWSFCNSTPNSIAARLLLLTILPAHTLYFLVIWLLSPANYVILTWQFYAVYMTLCLTQVFVLLLICEPMMGFLMKHHLDPDVFGIALLMSLADLFGTICLIGGFEVLATIHDPNAFGH